LPGARVSSSMLEAGLSLRTPADPRGRQYWVQRSRTRAVTRDEVCAPPGSAHLAESPAHTRFHQARGPLQRASFSSVVKGWSSSGVSGLLALVPLRCALDRRYPALAPLHPDLVYGLQLEGRVIQTSDPNLDDPVARAGCVKEPRPTAGAEGATVIARDLAADLKRLDRPVRIHTERTAGFFSAICAVATPDMHGVTANAVADRPAETSAGAYSCLHACR
jgi:hypothetical protein